MSRFNISVKPHTLIFKLPAGTSRGVYSERKVWYVYITATKDPNKIGIGECAPLPQLSCDDVPNYEDILLKMCKQVKKNQVLDNSQWSNYPSMIMGIETALRHYHAQTSNILWDTDFSRSKKGIAINGLIWMGTKETMLKQIENKLTNGYRCLKLKIGAIDFDAELDLLKHIRKHFSAKEIELRVDANGAFRSNDALKKLEALAMFNLHSIEQPIAAGQYEAMAKLCSTSPIAIALDEELIGINTLTDKITLLDNIKPQYIILKPSLHGGFCGSDEWIAEATKRNIPWWATSALESNIGLNAIAQWCATKNNPMPQGLGTGLLFENNIDMPLKIIGDELWYRD